MCISSSTCESIDYFLQGKTFSERSLDINSVCELLFSSYHQDFVCISRWALFQDLTNFFCGIDITISVTAVRCLFLPLIYLIQCSPKLSFANFVFHILCSAIVVMRILEVSVYLWLLGLNSNGAISLRIHWNKWVFFSVSSTWFLKLAQQHSEVDWFRDCEHMRLDHFPIGPYPTKVCEVSKETTCQPVIRFPSCFCMTFFRFFLDGYFLFLFLGSKFDKQLLFLQIVDTSLISRLPSSGFFQISQTEKIFLFPVWSQFCPRNYDDASCKNLLKSFLLTEHWQ